MRAVADPAGVAVGLVRHRYETDDGLRAAVGQPVVDHYAPVIGSVPNVGTPAQVDAARDEAVRNMRETHPTGGELHPAHSARSAETSAGQWRRRSARSR